MITGGCHDANGSDGALTVVLAPRGGSATRYDCTTIGRDSMFTLARSYHMMAGRLPKRLRAQQAPVDNEGGDWGSWEYFRFEREFCYVDLVEGTVYYCGIWYTYEGFVWVGGGGGGATGGTSEGGSGGVTTTGGTTTGITPLGPGPTADEVPVDELPMACPDTDPTCRVRPDSAQVLMMEEAFNKRFVATSEYADSSIRAQCELGRSALGAIIGTLKTNDGPIWVGRTSEEPRSYGFHLGEANPDSNRFHIDLEVFDSIRISPNSTFHKSVLLSMMMHEAVHLKPYRLIHPVADSILRGQRLKNPVDSLNPYSYEPPFAAIFSPVQGQRCAKF